MALPARARPHEAGNSGRFPAGPEPGWAQGEPDLAGPPGGLAACAVKGGGIDEADRALGWVAGIRVGTHWSVLVMVILIGWLLGGQVLPEMTPGQPAVTYWAVAVPCAVAFMAALLGHELAHSLVARRNGVPVNSITLWALGGISELGGEPPSARADPRIAAAGPATSLAAGLIFGGLAAAVHAGGGRASPSPRWAG